MAPSHEQPLNVRALISCAFDEEDQRLSLYRIVRDALAAWEGKVINCRVKPLVQDAFTRAGVEIGVWYGKEYGHLRLSVWGRNAPGAPSYDKRLQLELPPSNRPDDGPPRFSLAFFEEANRGYGTCAEARNQQRRAFLAAQWPEEIEALADDYLRARLALRAATDQTPDGFLVIEEVKRRERYL